MYIKQFLDSLGYKHPDRYPLSSKQQLEFKQQSYSACFVHELEQYIRKNQNDPIIYSIEQFRDLMCYYSCSSNNDDSKWMFAIGYDVATTALDYLLKSGEFS